MDENEDYLIRPAYHNGENDTINISDAKAEQITMITYSGEPVDQGVSLFGVTFGMTKSDVKAMLGEPMSDNGDYFEWQIAVLIPVMRVASLSTLPMMQTPPELRRSTCHLLKNKLNFGEQGATSALLFKLIHKNYRKK